MSSTSTSTRATSVHVYNYSLSPWSLSSAVCELGFFSVPPTELGASLPARRWEPSSTYVVGESGVDGGPAKCVVTYARDADDARVGWTTTAVAGKGGVSWDVTEDALHLLSISGHLEGPRNKVVVMLGTDPADAV